MSILVFVLLAIISVLIMIIITYRERIVGIENQYNLISFKMDFYRRVLFLKSNNVDLLDYLEKENVKNIAIYGAGELGEFLVNNMGIRPSYWIEGRRIFKNHLGIPVISIDEKNKPSVDLTIVTAYFSDEQEILALKEFINGDMISLSELLESCYWDFFEKMLNEKKSVDV